MRSEIAKVKASKLQLKDQTLKFGVKKKLVQMLDEIRPYFLVKDSGLREYSKLIPFWWNKLGPNLNIETLRSHPSTMN